VASLLCPARLLENLEIACIQCDDLHCFVQNRERRVSIEENGEVGEQYTFVGMDADTKVVFAWQTGKRTTANTITFMRALYSRTAWGLHPQLTTDGGDRIDSRLLPRSADSVDFAQLQKVYGPSSPDRGGYAPPRFREQYPELNREPRQETRGHQLHSHQNAPRAWRLASLIVYGQLRNSFRKDTKQQQNDRKERRIFSG
jgi:hypothetical protein